jgi:hypothetical protein
VRVSDGRWRVSHGDARGPWTLPGIPSRALAGEEMP